MAQDWLSDREKRKGRNFKSLVEPKAPVDAGLESLKVLWSREDGNRNRVSISRNHKDLRFGVYSMCFTQMRIYWELQKNMGASDN